MSAQTLIPCPGRRCGVENHIAGSGEAQRCAQIGQSMRGGSALGSTVSLASKASDPDAEVFAGVFAESTMIDEEEHAYKYSVSLETETSDEPIEIEYTKGKALVQNSGDPTASEVLYAMALDRRTLHDTGSAQALSDEFGTSNDPDWNNTHLDDDGVEAPGPSEAEKLYEKLVENDRKLTELLGDDVTALRRAIMNEEIEDEYSPYSWESVLGDPDAPINQPHVRDAYDDEQDAADAAEADRVLREQAGVRTTPVTDSDRAKGVEGSEESLRTALEWSPGGLLGLDYSDRSPEDFTEDSRAQVAADLAVFIATNREDLSDFDDVENIALNLMMSRNGEREGFYNLGLGERGNRLQEAAEAMGSLNVREIDRIGDPNKGKLEFWKPGM